MAQELASRPAGAVHGPADPSSACHERRRDLVGRDPPPGSRRAGSGAGRGGGGARDQASGSGASFTAVEAEGRSLVEDRHLDGLDGVPTYAVAATPGFITLIATRGAFGRAPDVVMSGINKCANTGTAFLHSGTDGAALTAGTNGCRALAVSLAGESPTNWETAARVTSQVLNLGSAG